MERTERKNSDPRARVHCPGEDSHKVGKGVKVHCPNGTGLEQGVPRQPLRCTLTNFRRMIRSRGLSVVVWSSSSKCKCLGREHESKTCFICAGLSHQLYFEVFILKHQKKTHLKNCPIFSPPEEFRIPLCLWELVFYVISKIGAGVSQTLNTTRLLTKHKGCTLGPLSRGAGLGGVRHSRAACKRSGRAGSLH